MYTNKYHLKCAKCGWSSGEFFIFCPHCKKDSLLKTFYNHKINIERDESLFSSYLNCLPINKITKSDFDPQIGLFKSSKIAESLNLKNLYILFNGYWPEKKAFNICGSFKTFEAISVLEKIAETDNILILSSAGNAARAAIQFSLLFGYRIIVVIPENAAQLMKVWNPQNLRNCFLITVRGGFYSEAIKTVEKIDAEISSLTREGGVYNVARRDALGAPFLRACMGMGQIPDHYFQAIGSGTGAIASWEASHRLVKDCLFQDRKMRLRLSQNHPFCPISQAWNLKKRDFIPYTPDEYHRRLDNVIASVLSNNTPPYSTYGGLFDALSETDGTVDSISNDEVNWAMDFCKKLKGIDLDMAAAVALASLKKAVMDKTVVNTDLILLHLTGGGYSRIMKDYNLSLYQPDISVTYDSSMENLFEAIDSFLNFTEQ